MLTCSRLPIIELCCVLGSVSGKTCPSRDVFKTRLRLNTNVATWPRVWHGLAHVCGVSRRTCVGALVLEKGGMQDKTPQPKGHWYQFLMGLADPTRGMSCTTCMDLRKSLALADVPEQSLKRRHMSPAVQEVRALPPSRYHVSTLRPCEPSQPESDSAQGVRECARHRVGGCRKVSEVHT